MILIIATLIMCTIINHLTARIEMSEHETRTRRLWALRATDQIECIDGARTEGGE